MTQPKAHTKVALKKRHQVLDPRYRRTILKRLTAASLRHGLSPYDAVKRAVDAYAWLRSVGRTEDWNSEFRLTVLRFTMVEMEAGAEIGRVCVAKAIEATRLIKNHVSTTDDRGNALNQALGEVSVPPATPTAERPPYHPHADKTGFGSFGGV